MAELSKLARVKNHFTGEPCNCKFLKCFENITVHEKQTLIDDFVYKYETKDQQDSLYTVGGSKAAKMWKGFYARNSSYSYNVKVVRDGACIEIKVCFKAMLSLFGITNRRMQTVKSALYETGHSPIDKRGLGPKPWALRRLPVSYQNNKMFYLYWTFASQILGCSLRTYL